LIKYDTDPDFVEKRNDIQIKFLAICIGIGILHGIEKILFGVTGENLTAAVRKDLVRGILYK